MKRALLLTAALLLAATPVLAGGVNLNWGPTGWSQGMPQNLLTFACNTNTGSATMTISFATSFDQLRFTGIEATLEGRATEQTVPAWWQMAPGECRESAVSSSANFLSAPQDVCLDVWGNQAVGGMTYIDGEPAGGANLARTRIS
jgi:hypothetical protein